ncbi:MAG: DUF3298 and DUF4163 domain-containing protein [Pseudomonadota bacterium]|nr:DUF3298 and DUF4163 domain-containing protein [Pseudomonadota bacterium]
MKHVAALLLLVLTLAACDRGSAPPVSAPSPAATTPASPPDAATVAMEDVIETTSDYVIGISYTPTLSKYPPLAAIARRYADEARADLMQAVGSREAGAGNAMYDLSLTFSEVLDSPTLVAIAADGSSYTGGAHGTPLLARFVWLPQQNRLLKATDLIPDRSGWQAIAAHVREQLHTAMSQRIDADELPAGERSQVMKNAGGMIDEGTEPDPANFAQFEPVAQPSGALAGLRFVFAPYQVGPYSDGVQTVQVPASVLLPHVAPAYRDLFANPDRTTAR